MKADLYTGDCLDVLPTLPPNSVDTIITDPPYGLRFMGKGCAAVAEERDFIGIDLSDPDVQVAAQRIKHWGGAMFTDVHLNHIGSSEPHV